MQWCDAVHLRLHVVTVVNHTVSVPVSVTQSAGRRTEGWYLFISGGSSHGRSPGGPRAHRAEPSRGHHSQPPGPHRTRQPAVPAPFATVRARPGPFRPVKTAPGAPGGGFDGTERAGTRSDGRKQGRNSGLTGAVRTGRQSPRTARQYARELVENDVLFEHNAAAVCFESVAALVTWEGATHGI